MPYPFSPLLLCLQFPAVWHYLFGHGSGDHYCLLAFFIRYSTYKSTSFLGYAGRIAFSQFSRYHPIYVTTAPSEHINGEIAEGNLLYCYVWNDLF